MVAPAGDTMLRPKPLSSERDVSAREQPRAEYQHADQDGGLGWESAAVGRTARARVSLDYSREHRKLGKC